MGSGNYDRSVDVDLGSVGLEDDMTEFPQRSYRKPARPGAPEDPSKRAGL